MKEGWEPAGARFQVKEELVRTLVHAVLPGARIARFRKLEGGLANVNVRVDLEGRPQPLVLRIYLRESNAGALERAVSLRLRGQVPVPVYLHWAAGNPVSGHPFALLEWLEGTRVDEVLAGIRTDPGACRELGESVGRTLACLGQVKYRQAGLLSIELELWRPMGRGGFLDLLGEPGRALARQRLGEDRWEECRQILAGESGPLAGAELPACLVHGDFDLANLLADRVAGRWTVTGVLDWEFVHSGSPLEDLGHILRPPADGCPGFREGLAEGYRSGGGTLPRNWARAAQLMDLPAWVEFLSRPGAGPEVVRTAREQVVRILGAKPTRV